jgi:hypothetical protein
MLVRNYIYKRRGIMWLKNIGETRDKLTYIRRGI